MHELCCDEEWMLLLDAVTWLALPIRRASMLTPWDVHIEPQYHAGVGQLHKAADT